MRKRHRLATGLLCASSLLCWSLPGACRAAASTDARYTLANGCYALRTAGGRYVRSLGRGYAASTFAADQAEPFYLKPTALGSYLLYDHNGRFLAAGGLGIDAAAGASAAADWTVTSDAAGNFQLGLGSPSRQLAVTNLFGTLGVTARPSSFRFVAASGCAAFPEAGVNATGTPFQGHGVDRPVLGFADSHVHITATDFLGHAHAGRPFHPYGITQALGSCEDRHGVDGMRDVIGNFMTLGTPIATHDTTGWPTFRDWPSHQSLTHEQTYYKWLERAWRGGERLLVNFLVENQTLCELEAPLQGLKGFDCNEMDSVRTQVGQIHDLQDYVDAQEGGPGKGWFRIVTSPAEARDVINRGKLAVVLGIETSHLFDCAERNGVPACDRASIDRELDEFYGLGVRTVFPLHEFNNAYGGNGIFMPLIDLGNLIDTGALWRTYDCPVEPYLYGAGAPLPQLGNAAAPTSLAQWRQTADSAAPAGPNQCNQRTITDLGRYLVARLMARKMMIEIDHMELQMKSQVLDIAEAQTPVYPVMSGHGGHGGISMEQAQRIYNVGGLIFPYKGNGRGYAQFLPTLESLRNDKYYFGVGFGADTNGMAGQAAPRGGGQPVSYPFTLFQGGDWGSDFAGVQPVTFDQQRTGERSFDTDVDGFAHYGMMPDFVEEVRIEGGAAALGDLFHSAEAYLEMWERVENR
ncbi:MAG: hypothetical protein P4L83_15360 [Nevskia sp.]|nr:hypothetical protein [Nevskia sp.]